MLSTCTWDTWVTVRSASASQHYIEATSKVGQMTPTPAPQSERQVAGVQARHRSTAPPKSTESQIPTGGARAQQNLPLSSSSSTSANTHLLSRRRPLPQTTQQHTHKTYHQPSMSDFDKAVADSKKLVSKPSNDELLQLYGMFAPRPRPRPRPRPPLFTRNRAPN